MSIRIDTKEPPIVATVLAMEGSSSSSSSSSTPTATSSPTTSDSDTEVEFSPLALADDLTPLPAYKAAGTTETDFGGLLPVGKQLRLHEDLANGCGGQLWPAGMTLARYMLRYQA